MIKPQKQTVYLVGIKGAGMAGLAQILKARGFRVSGSDTPEKFFTDAILKQAGIKYFENFSLKNLPKKISWAVASSAYLGRNINNPEINELRKRKIPILPYARAVGKIFNQSPARKNFLFFSPSRIPAQKGAKINQGFGQITFVAIILHCHITLALA